MNFLDTPEATEITELKNALQPVQQELRAMYDNAEFAAKDLVGLAAKSLSDLSASAREIINPVDRSLPRNIVQETKNLAVEARDKAIEVFVRAINDLEPIQSNERSALITAGDALRMIQNKYLTPDGQKLVRAITGIAKKVPFA